MLLKSSLLTLLIITVSCAHHRDVRPSVDGEHVVMIQTEDRTKGYSSAKSQADHYCEKNGNRRAFIVTEGHKYVGSMDEKEYQRYKTVSKVAQRVGGAGVVFGGKREKNAGGIVGIGGGIADQTLGNAYTYRMKFKCK